MAKKNMMVESMMADLMRRCSGNNELEQMAVRVRNEFNKITEYDSKIKRADLRYTLMVMHITRALDTGLETFNKIYGNLEPELKYHVLGNYMKKLRNPLPHTHAPLPQGIYDMGAKGADSITGRRNKYMHRADTCPNNTAADELINDVYKFFAAVLDLSLVD